MQLYKVYKSRDESEKGLSASLFGLNRGAVA